MYSFKEFQPIFPESNNFWTADNATIIGKVEIREKVSIWFGAVLRGDNELIFIDEGSNIQENCVLHTDMGYPLTIGRNCTIGHNAILHGATIEDSSLVGMGAIILNGAKISKNSLVGAGALVTEGKEFPPNSLIVGKPAKFVRQLTSKEINEVNNSAINYQENSRNFKSYCKKLS
tara:strand:- start:2206 stop:2730 length:525 start_codon:yes stop_codon:yes gene_type:complete